MSWTAVDRAMTSLRFSPPLSGAPGVAELYRDFGAMLRNTGKCRALHVEVLHSTSKIVRSAAHTLEYVEQARNGVLHVIETQRPGRASHQLCCGP